MKTSAVSIPIRRSALSFLQAGLVLLAASLRAGVLVVDNAHPAASDDNPGTREAPLLTISAAAARVQPGDEVLVRPGLYREAVRLTVSGREDAPIVFRSEAPRAAVISGSDVITEWREEEPGVWSFAEPGRFLYPGQYVHGAWMYVDGRPLQYAEQRERLTPGSYHLDAEAKRIFVAPPEDATFDGSRFEFAWREGLFFPTESLDDIHIIGFKLVHNANWFRGAPAIQTTGRRWRVENNHIAWASYFGLANRSCNRSVVRGNLIEWCGNSGVVGGRTLNLLFEDNTVRYNNWRRTNPSMEGGGSKWSSIIDSIFRGNRWYGNHGSGLWVDYFGCDTLYESNVAHDNTIWGLFSELNWNMIIRDNVAYNNYYGVMVAQNQGTVVRRNIFFNNDVGMIVRGDGTSPTRSSERFPRHMESMRAIPDADPLVMDRFEAGCLKMYMAPKFAHSNNSVFWENVVFDSQWRNYYEARNYAVVSPTDVYVHNHSDHNLWHALRPDAGFHHAGGTYPDGLKGWQEASGRDLNSRAVDPRVADDLPDWVAERRAQWDIAVRPIVELRALGLVDSPEGQAAKIRVSRSPTLEPVALGDGSIRAFRFEVDGEPVLGLWTTHPQERRYVRLKLDGDRATVEDAYLNAVSRIVRDGRLDLVVTYVPTYVRGIGETVEEAPMSGMRAPMFNRVGEPVPVTATFVNPGGEPATVRAAFTASAEFRADPAAVERTLAPGSSETVEVRLHPVGAPRKGAGRVRMEADVGGERLVRVVSFGVGESEGVIPRAPGRIRVDGTLDDWGTRVTDGLPIGVIAGAEQFANGDLDRWGGPGDLSAEIYAAWTPEMLYVAVVVTDDAVIPTLPGGAPWGQDAIELFVDGRAFDMQWQVEPTDGCYQIGVSPAKDDVPVNAMVFQKTLHGLQAASSLTDTGYIIEIGLPLSRRNFPAGDWMPGRPVKMSVLVNDKDDPEAVGRKYTFGWAHSENGRNYDNTSGWQTLTLGE